MKHETLIYMLFDLLSGKQMSASELADKYKISTRTVYRYADELNVMGIPVEIARGRKGGLYISDSYKLPVGFMTREEYEATIRALEAMKGQICDPRIDAALEKIRAQCKREDYNFTVSNGQILIDNSAWTGENHLFNDKLETILRASTETKVLKIRYISATGEETEREIEPLILVFKQNVWYIYAWCRTRCDFRIFRINRIRNVTVTPKKFAPRSVDRSRLNLHFSENEDAVEVRFSFPESLLGDMIDWLGIESIQKQNEEYTVQMRFPDTESLVDKILGFGTKLNVISPVSLRKKVAEAAQRIAAKYTQKAERKKE